MPRLPIVGDDDGVWGEYLNNFLKVSLDDENVDEGQRGKLKPSAVAESGAYMKAEDSAADVAYDDTALQAHGVTGDNVQEVVESLATETSGYFSTFSTEKISYTEASTSNIQFVVDEDDFTSNSSTKIPTQQSVKAYVDAGLSDKASDADVVKIAGAQDISGVKTMTGGSFHVIDSSTPGHGKVTVGNIAGGAMSLYANSSDADPRMVLHSNNGLAFGPGGSAPTDTVISRAAANVLSFNSSRISQVSDPTDAQDAATKNYVDTELSGKVDDDQAVKLTGDQQISGQKFFSNAVVANHLGAEVASFGQLDINEENEIDILEGSGFSQIQTGPSAASMLFTSSMDEHGEVISIGSNSSDGAYIAFGGYGNIKAAITSPESHHIAFTDLQEEGEDIRLSGVANPTEGQDAATKNYVDSSVLQPSVATGTGYRANIPYAWFDSLRATSGIRYVVVMADSFGVFGIGSFPWLLEKHLIRMTNTKADPQGWLFAKGGGAAPAWSSSQGTVSENTISGYGATMTSGQKGSTIAAVSDGITVFYRKSPGAGSLIVRDGVGGTVLTTIDTNGTAGIDSWTSSALPSQLRVFEFEATGGTVVVDGSYQTQGNRTNGIRVISASRSGDTSQGIATNPVRGLQLLEYLDSIGQLALVVTATGTNDDPGKGWQGQLIDAVKLTAPNTPVVSWIPPINSANPPAEYEAMKADVLSRDVVMIDGTMLGRIDSGDNVHPSARGSSEIAMQIATVLSGNPIGAQAAISSNSAVSLYGDSDISGSITVASKAISLGIDVFFPVFSMKEAFGEFSNPQIRMLTRMYATLLGIAESPVLQFGNGEGDLDVNLYRDDVATLKTSGNFVVGEPSNDAGSVLTVDGTQTLTNKTHTSPVINGSVSGDAIDTDPTLDADSDTKLATQKAVKAYVDNSTSGSATPAQKRVTTIASSATPAINADEADAVTITALATDITSMSTSLTGTPTDFQSLIIRIKDDGTTRAISWGASFESKGVDLPIATIANKVTTVGLLYDAVTAKWGCVASVTEA